MEGVAPLSMNISMGVLSISLAVNIPLSVHGIVGYIVDLCDCVCITSEVHCVWYSLDVNVI